MYPASLEQDVPVQWKVRLERHMEVGNTLRHDLTKGITICNNKRPLNVGAIISKCQSNYSLAWLIVHKVIKEGAGPISHIRQSATKPQVCWEAQLGGSSAHFAA